jgi:hypothetical protein
MGENQLDAVAEIKRDAVAALQTDSLKRARDAIRLRVQFAKRDRAIFKPNRDFVCVARKVDAKEVNEVHQNSLKNWMRTLRAQTNADF